jgi:ubiquitin
MSINDTPFNTKIKLECDCGACESKYKIIYFEDETTGDIKLCPFCGEAAEEFAETNAALVSEDNKNIDDETLYTDDEYARFEEEIVDDDDDDAASTTNSKSAK